VSLVVADGLPNETKDGVKIYGLKKETNRFSRMLNSPKIVYKKALELNADIYHLHDPELIPIGIKLKKKGKKVIFDSHEDIPDQILGKPYLNQYLLKIISRIYAIYERNILKYFDRVIAATPFIQGKISRWCSFVTNINNYPITSEFGNVVGRNDTEVPVVCFIGMIMEISGIKQIIEALEYCKTNVRLKLAGNFSPTSLHDEVIQYKGWEKVDELGFLDRKKMNQIFSLSLAGIVCPLPLPDHLNSQPNKMFEYMSAGLPVIASNFPHYQRIIEENNCGICVDPYKPGEITGAIDYVVNNRVLAYEMGRNGRKAVEKKYNWKIEEIKLLDVYDGIFAKNMIK
jgi:glycosyltransferase involved in cell wall biosynthesis